ncbi:MAG: hypothetical protein IIV73_06515, partial [Bacteroidaceae bacterium]|nr:hypothetical protein [Bacteroidaceae bacterium]
VNKERADCTFRVPGLWYFGRQSTYRKNNRSFSNQRSMVKNTGIEETKSSIPIITYNIKII